MEFYTKKPPKEAGQSLSQSVMSKPIASSQLAEAPPQSKGEVIAKGLAALNHRPIEIYGKVVDQYGVPVEGASIAGSTIIRNISGFSGKSEKYTTVTDQNGLFQFKGMYGESMGVWPSKPGYEFKGTNTSFVFSLMYPKETIYTPDANNPTVLTMWKLQGAEPLMVVEIEKYHGLPFDGTPVYVDLEKNRITANQGDLKITLKRNPLHPDLGKKFDWSLIVEGVGGGLVESTTAYQNEAPAEGYQSEFKYAMSAEGAHWQDGMQKRFFVKSKNGKLYGWVDLNVYARYQEGVGITIEGRVNPNGSRNLEYDRKKIITPVP
jgi:hypothetical protein